MIFPFYKYQGTGNDFIMIDNRQLSFPKNNTEFIAKLCDRKFGIGADGLILLEQHPELDFTMVYFNADGNPSSMCGNGGRCIVEFAKLLGIIEAKTTFQAVDGSHEATIEGSIVSLKMNNVGDIIVSASHAFLDTGSPHHVELVTNLDELDIRTKGAYLRYNSYGKDGANINFVEEIDSNVFAVRTYERGVEDETLSCGTGVTAVAIAMFETGKATINQVVLKTPGGNLMVKFAKTAAGYEDIYLEGPANFVFKGNWK